MVQTGLFFVLGLNVLIEDIKILIAEDEAELREYLAEYIGLLFKHVITAKCGHDAYMKYLDKKPDIILADINMPNLDGLSVISRIRERDSDTKIIIMSAHSEKEKLFQAIKLQLVTYLVKPIKTDELKEILFELSNEIHQSGSKIFLSENIYWDRKSHILCYKDSEIVLKEREYMLIELLCSRVDHPFSAENIFYHIYSQQSEKEFSHYAVTSLIKRIRAKLQEDIIKNEYGLGYKVKSVTFDNI